MSTTRKPAAKKATTKAAAKPRPDVYQIVTDALLAKLEAGTVAWRKPWHELGAPRNYVSGRFYSGINSFLLNMSGCLPFFLTFKQAKELGGSIRKGAKGYPVIFFKLLTRKEGTAPAPTAGQPAEDKKIPLLQYYTVFSVEDVEGVEIKLPEVAPQPEHQPVTACEQVLAGWATKPKITHMQQRAYYSPVMDYVNMPKPESFSVPVEYYATLFHELGHATGHKSRLNREGITEAIKFGSESYAREELVAEMSAAFLCAVTGIAPQVIDNSAAYLVSWLNKLNPDQKNAVPDSDAYRAFWVEKLKENKKLVVQAASRAKQAAEYILGTTPEEGPADEEEGQEPAQAAGPAPTPPASRQEAPTAAAPAVAEAPRDEVAAEYEAAEKSWLAQDEATKQQQVSNEYEAAEKSWLTEGGDNAAPLPAETRLDLYVLRPYNHMTTTPRDQAGRPDFDYLRPDVYDISPAAAAAIMDYKSDYHRPEYVVVFAGTHQEVAAPLVPPKW